MHWPADHPIRTDPPLTRWQADSEAACPSGQPVRVLRHVRGRRVASLVDTPSGDVVLKVFASPRARGNDRRLHLLRPVVGALVPRPLAVGPAGHAGLVEYVPGQALTDLDGADLADGCAELGRSLARLHRCSVVLDRRWTVVDEMTALEARDPTAAVRDRPAPDDLVPGHRDLHPGQVVVTSGGVRLIDLDEAAMAPAGLDVGNLLAHLDRDAAVGARAASEVTAAGEAFLAGYGRPPRDLAWWREIALVRLAALAEVRHGRPDWAEALRALVS